ncbi:MAG: hypothetical protein GY869_26075 [Planctomycetes bacterium]|nr:hypothetical protein [Planctomycetota bacterium]
MHSHKKFICLTLGLISLSLIGGCGPDDGGSARIFPGMSQSAGPSQLSYTIVLAQLSRENENGLTAAQQVRDQAKLLLGVQDVWLENDNQWISVNYGHFFEQLGANAVQQELLRVRQLYPQLGLGPYQFCYIKELPEPDPPAQPGWYLLNNSCFYTLEVGTYYNVPEKGYFSRKVDAVAAVQNLRNEGVQAYFIHGRTETRIYVGCFSATAVQQGMQGNYQLQGLSKEMLDLKKKYQYHENGMKIFDIRKAQSGAELRIGKPLHIVMVDTLAAGILF